MGEPGPDPGELFFSAPNDLTLTKARTPTAEAVGGKTFDIFALYRHFGGEFLGNVRQHFVDISSRFRRTPDAIS